MENEQNVLACFLEQKLRVSVSNIRRILGASRTCAEFYLNLLRKHHLCTATRGGTDIRINNNALDILGQNKL